MEASGVQIAIAGMVFVVMTITFVVLSAILNHHWNRYEVDGWRRRRARAIYFSVAGILMILMAFSFLFMAPAS